MADVIKQYTIKINADVSDAEKKIKELGKKSTNVEGLDIAKQFQEQKESLGGIVGGIKKDIKGLSESINKLDSSSLISGMQDAANQISETSNNILKLQEALQQLTDSSNFKTFSTDMKEQFSSLSTIVKDALDTFQNLGNVVKSISEGTFNADQLIGIGDIETLLGRRKKLQDKLYGLLHQYNNEEEGRSNIFNSRLTDQTIGDAEKYQATLESIIKTVQTIQNLNQVLTRRGQHQIDVEKIFSAKEFEGLTLGEVKGDQKEFAEKIDKYYGVIGDTIKDVSKDKSVKAEVNVEGVVKLNIESSEKSAESVVDELTQQIKEKIINNVQKKIQRKPIRIPIGYTTDFENQDKKKSDAEIEKQLSKNDIRQEKDVIQSLNLKIDTNTSDLMSKVKSAIESINQQIVNDDSYAVKVKVIADTDMQSVSDLADDATDEIRRRAESRGQEGINTSSYSQGSFSINGATSSVNIDQASVNIANANVSIGDIGGIVAESVGGVAGKDAIVGSPSKTTQTNDNSDIVYNSLLYSIKSPKTDGIIRKDKSDETNTRELSLSEMRFNENRFNVLKEFKSFITNERKGLEDLKKSEIYNAISTDPETGKQFARYGEGYTIDEFQKRLINTFNLLNDKMNSVINGSTIRNVNGEIVSEGVKTRFDRVQKETIQNQIYQQQNVTEWQKILLDNLEKKRQSATTEEKLKAFIRNPANQDSIKIRQTEGQKPIDIARDIINSQFDKAVGQILSTSDFAAASQKSIQFPGMKNAKTIEEQFKSLRTSALEKARESVLSDMSLIQGGITKGADEGGLAFTTTLSSEISRADKNVTKWGEAGEKGYIAPKSYKNKKSGPNMQEKVRIANGIEIDSDVGTILNSAKTAINERGAVGELKAALKLVRERAAEQLMQQNEITRTTQQTLSNMDEFVELYNHDGKLSQEQVSRLDDLRGAIALNMRDKQSEQAETRLKELQKKVLYGEGLSKGEKLESDQLSDLVEATKQGFAQNATVDEVYEFVQTARERFQKEYEKSKKDERDIRKNAAQTLDAISSEYLVNGVSSNKDRAETEHKRRQKKLLEDRKRYAELVDRMTMRSDSGVFDTSSLTSTEQTEFLRLQQSIRDSAMLEALYNEKYGTPEDKDESKRKTSKTIKNLGLSEETSEGYIKLTNAEVSGDISKMSVDELNDAIKLIKQAKSEMEEAYEPFKKMKDEDYTQKAKETVADDISKLKQEKANLEKEREAMTDQRQIRKQDRKIQDVDLSIRQLQSSEDLQKELVAEREKLRLANEKYANLQKTEASSDQLKSAQKEIDNTQSRINQLENRQNVAKQIAQLQLQMNDIEHEQSDAQARGASKNELAEIESRKKNTQKQISSLKRQSDLDYSSLNKETQQELKTLVASRQGQIINEINRMLGLDSGQSVNIEDLAAFLESKQSLDGRVSTSQVFDKINNVLGTDSGKSVDIQDLERYLSTQNQLKNLVSDSDQSDRKKLEALSSQLAKKIKGQTGQSIPTDEKSLSQLSELMQYYSDTQQKKEFSYHLLSELTKSIGKNGITTDEKELSQLMDLVNAYYDAGEMISLYDEESNVNYKNGEIKPRLAGIQTEGEKETKTRRQNREDAVKTRLKEQEQQLRIAMENMDRMEEELTIRMQNQLAEQAQLSEQEEADKKQVEEQKRLSKLSTSQKVDEINKKYSDMVSKLLTEKESNAKNMKKAESEKIDTKELDALNKQIQENTQLIQMERERISVSPNNSPILQEYYDNDEQLQKLLQQQEAFESAQKDRNRLYAEIEKESQIQDKVKNGGKAYKRHQDKIDSLQSELDVVEQTVSDYYKQNISQQIKDVKQNIMEQVADSLADDIYELQDQFIDAVQRGDSEDNILSYRNAYLSKLNEYESLGIGQMDRLSYISPSGTHHGYVEIPSKDGKKSEYFTARDYALKYTTSTYDNLLKEREELLSKKQALETQHKTKKASKENEIAIGQKYEKQIDDDVQRLKEEQEQAIRNVYLDAFEKAKTKKEANGLIEQLGYVNISEEEFNFDANEYSKGNRAISSINDSYAARFAKRSNYGNRIRKNLRIDGQSIEDLKSERESLMPQVEAGQKYETLAQNVKQRWSSQDKLIDGLISYSSASVKNYDQEINQINSDIKSIDHELSQPIDKKPSESNEEYNARVKSVKDNLQQKKHDLGDRYAQIIDEQAENKKNREKEWSSLSRRITTATKNRQIPGQGSLSQEDLLKTVYGRFFEQGDNYRKIADDLSQAVSSGKDDATQSSLKAQLAQAKEDYFASIIDLLSVDRNALTSHNDILKDLDQGEQKYRNNISLARNILEQQKTDDAAKILGRKSKKSIDAEARVKEIDSALAAAEAFISDREKEFDRLTKELESSDASGNKKSELSQRSKGLDAKERARGAKLIHEQNRDEYKSLTKDDYKKFYEGSKGDERNPWRSWFYAEMSEDEAIISRQIHDLVDKKFKNNGLDEFSENLLSAYQEQARSMGLSLTKYGSVEAKVSKQDFFADPNKYKLPTITAEKALAAGFTDVKPVSDAITEVTGSVNVANAAEIGQGFNSSGLALESTQQAVLGAIQSLGSGKASGTTTGNGVQTKSPVAPSNLTREQLIAQYNEKLGGLKITDAEYKNILKEAVRNQFGIEKGANGSFKVIEDANNELTKDFIKTNKIKVGNSKSKVDVPDNIRQLFSETYKVLNSNTATDAEKTAAKVKAVQSGIMLNKKGRPVLKPEKASEEATAAFAKEHGIELPNVSSVKVESNETEVNSKSSEDKSKKVDTDKQPASSKSKKEPEYKTQKPDRIIPEGEEGLDEINRVLRIKPKDNWPQEAKDYWSARKEFVTQVAEKRNYTKNDHGFYENQQGKAEAYRETAQAAEQAAQAEEKEAKTSSKASQATDDTPILSREEIQKQINRAKGNLNRSKKEEAKNKWQTKIDELTNQLNDIPENEEQPQGDEEVTPEFLQQLIQTTKEQIDFYEKSLQQMQDKESELAKIAKQNIETLNQKLAIHETALRELQSTPDIQEEKPEVKVSQTKSDGKQKKRKTKYTDTNDAINIFNKSEPLSEEDFIKYIKGGLDQGWSLGRAKNNKLFFGGEKAVSKEGVENITAQYKDNEEALHSLYQAYLEATEAAKQHAKAAKESGKSAKEAAEDTSASAEEVKQEDSPQKNGKKLSRDEKKKINRRISDIERSLKRKKIKPEEKEALQSELEELVGMLPEKSSTRQRYMNGQKQSTNQKPSTTNVSGKQQTPANAEHDSALAGDTNALNEHKQALENDTQQEKNDNTEQNAKTDFNIPPEIKAVRDTLLKLGVQKVSNTDAYDYKALKNGFFYKDEYNPEGLYYRSPNNGPEYVQRGGYVSKNLSMLEGFEKNLDREMSRGYVQNLMSYMPEMFRSSDIQNEIREAQKKAKDLLSLQGKTRDENGISLYNSDEIKGFQDTLREIVATAQKYRGNISDAINVGQVSSGFASARADMEAYVNSLNNSSVAIQKFNNNELEMTYTLRTADNMLETHVVSVDRTGAIYDQLANSTKYLNPLQQALNGLGTKFREIFNYVIASTSIYEVINMVKQAVSMITEMDTAMTNLRKVAEGTTEQFNSFKDASFGIAKQTGSTATSVVDAATEWARLGYSLEDSSKLAQTSIVYSNVGELDAATATTDLVSALKAFDIEAENAMHVVDVMNEIGNNYAISSAQIGEVLEKSSSSLAVSGDDLEHVTAMAAAMNEVIQDASVTGSTLKVVGLRLRGAKTELTDMDEETDGMVTSTSKLRSKIMGLTNVDGKGGFDIMLDSKNFKSTYDIMKGIADVWDDMAQIDQAALLELIAGKNRAQGAAALISNFETAEKALNDAYNSEGSAMKENDKYLDSIQGKMNQFKTSVQELANTTINTDDIKMIVDLGTELLSIVNSLIKQFGGLKTILGAVAAIFLQKNGFNLFNFDKISKTWSTKDFTKSIKNFFVKAFTKVKVPDEVSNFFAGKNLTDKLFGEDGVLARKGFQQTPEAVQEFAKEAINAGNATATVGDAIDAASTKVVSFGGLLKNLGNIGLTVLSSLGTTALVMAASMALEAIATGVYNLIHADEIAIQKGKEATQAIKDRYDAYEQLKDTISETDKQITGKDDIQTTEESITTIAERYDELHDGVNELSNANENLSTDKYQEYLDLCNKLAEQSPSLVSGYDSQGNAILNLGNTAAEAEAALMRMYEAEKLAANVEIAQNIQDSYTGFNTQIKEKKTENTDISTNIKDLEEKYKESKQQSEQIEQTISQYTENAKKAKQAEKELEQAMSNAPAGPYKPLSNDEITQRMASVAKGEMTMAEAFPQMEEKKAKNKLAQYQSEEIDGWANINEDTLFIPQYIDGFHKELNRIVSQYGLVAQSIDQYTVGEAAEFTVDGLNKLSTDELNEIQNQIANYVQSAINSQTEQLQLQLKEQTSQKSANDLYIQDQTKSIQGIISNYLNTSDVFGEQSTDVQNAILNNLDSLDLSVISDKYGGQIVPYIYGELIQPINDLKPEAQKALTELFEIKPNNKTANEYIQALVNQIHEVAGDDKKAQQIWEGLLGVDKVQDEISSAQSIIRKEFMTTDAYGHVLENNMTDEQLEQLYGLSLDDLRIYADLVRDGVYKTWEELQKAFEDAKNQKAPESTDTLSTLLNSEDYKSFAETASSNLSSLTGALETLRTEGSLTAEEMVNLQNSFPDLTEFTTKSIQTKAFEELDGWISKIREGMDSMSEEGKKQAQTMIQNMIDQYGDLGVNMEQIHDTFIDSLDLDLNTTAGHEQAKGELSVFDQQVEELRSRLESEGLELDTHVLYTIVASDQFSGTADEILAKYKDAQINWKITLDNQDLERHIEYQQGVINREVSAKSLKEANGEVLTPEDYKVSTTSAKSIARMRNRELENAITVRDAINDHRSSEYAVANKKVVEAEQAALEAQIEAAQAEKEEIESATNEYQNKVTQADNAVTAAQNAIDAAEAEVGEGMADQKLYVALAEAYAVRAAANLALSGKWEEIANEHPEWYEEFIGNSLSAASSAQSDTESANGYDNIDSQQKLNQLQEDATKIQRNLTVAEQNHQKVSKSTYNALIHNAKDQIKLLKEERDANKDNISVWREKQDQIDSLSDSIYEWSTTADSLIYDQASQLASTISTAMSESISETGLTDDTINALKTAFSDLDGSKFDVSDAFYSTADGVKINTEALQELTKAEFELIGAPLANEIANVQAQLDANPGDSALQQKLENLMETNAKYFAQYEEMQKALSHQNRMDLAESTANAGANYDANYERSKKYKEAYEKGLTGTDDFKEFTAYADVYGRDTIEAYEAVSSKIQRYFTEDAADGLSNFLTDMEKLGYAAQDADGYWTITADDYDAAAKDMQMGSEWFMDTMNKLEDFGFIHTYVDSLNEAQLKTRDVEEQIADAVQTYSDMVARGASDDDLQKQIEHINELESQWQNLGELTETWGEVDQANRKKEFLGIDDQLSAFEEMYKNADTDAGRDAARKAAEDYVKQFGYTLEEGKFKLSADDLVDYESRITTFSGSMENPLTAEDMGISADNVEKFNGAIDNVKQLAESGDLSSIQEAISGLTAEDLKNIDYSDGKYTEGFEAAEGAVDQLRDSLGLAKEDTNLLIDVMTALGLVEGQTVDSVPEKMQQLQDYLSTATKENGEAYQISTDVASQSAEQLQTQLDEIDLAIEAQLDPDSDVYKQLEELRKQTEIQLNIKNSDQTQTQLKEWAETGDRENIAKTFGIDVNSEEVDRYIQQIQNMPSDYDLAVHIDDSQFQTLIESITGEPYQAEVEVVGKDKVTQFVNKIKQKLQSNPITQPIVQKVQQFGQKVKQQITTKVDSGNSGKEVNKVENSVEDLNKTTGTAKVNVNTKGALSGIQNVRNQLLSLNSVVATPRINVITGNATSIISQIRDAINQLRDKTVTLTTIKRETSALGTAHASGTTSLSRAYANGKDWTVGRDESALVNEIGQESRVRDGVWELIPGGPHVEDLRKDDIIFNAEQTADLIRTGKTARQGKLVAYANGTVNGMSAYRAGNSVGKLGKGSTSSNSKKSNGGNGGNGNKGGKTSGKSKSNKQTELEKWLEKLFDWIEVRLDRIQRRIDNATQQAENSIGFSTKNSYVNTAMDETRSLIANNQAGEQRYYQQAEAVYQKATSGKKKLLSADKAQKIIQKIKDGTIDINEYSEKERKFIDAYKEWYDKALDCRDAVYQLEQQLKELQQTKLDNITEEFETIADSLEAIKASSEATVDYYNAVGRAVGTADKVELDKQLKRQEDITRTLQQEGASYRAELANAASIFGVNSNEYREASNKLEEINKALIESQTTELELSKTIREFSFELRNNFIKRVKALVDKFSSIASLAEKRGTTSVYGINTAQTESLYTDQIKHNNDLILKYYENINDKRKEIAEKGWAINSKAYEEAYDQITQDESAILSLFSANEDLKDSIRTLRWKPYTELNKELDQTKSDLEHINSFIRDGEIFDDDAQITERGYARIALIAKEMDIAEKKDRNAREAMKKLDEELANHVINLEEYNEGMDEQVGIIQDAASILFDDKTKLADIYIDQITKENDALQKLIDARRDALSAKKEYYDYDKTLKNKNKDIAQLQAQINALQGVTNDAAQARRAKLQAELQEKQEDLQDTLYQHSIDLQQEGYNKLSEDMQAALDRAVELINGKIEVLNQTAASMLTQLKNNGFDESGTIKGIIADNATAVHTSTDAMIEALSGEGEIGQLLTDLGVYMQDNKPQIDIATAINNRIPESAVSNIDTSLSLIYDSLNNDIKDNLANIEFALGSLNPSEEDKARIEAERKEKLVELNKQIEVLTYQIEMENGNINANEAIISKKQSQINEAQGNIDTLYNNIASLYAQRDADYAQANANNAAADNWMVKAQKAKKKAKKNEYINNANVLRQQAEQLITRAKNAQVQIDTLEAAKNGVVDYNNSIINTLTSEINSLNNTVSGYKTNLDDLNDQLKELQDKKLELELPESITTPETARGEHNVSGVDIDNTQTPKTVYDTNDVAAQTQATQAAAQAAQAAAVAAQAAAQIIEKIRVDENGDPILHYAKGTKRIHKDQLAWTNEYADKVGSEMIVRPSDGAILTPLKANDSVIPANLADNLFKWGAISPDKFITNPFVGKWSAEGGSSVTNNADYTAAPQTVEMHFDSLFHIEGNVDESVMPRLENLGKSLVNDRDFQKNVIKFVTKDFVRESKKQGIR